MVQLHSSASPIYSRKYRTIFLAFCWIVGLAFGIELSFTAGDSFLYLMRGSYGSVSIVHLLLITLLPFLFSGMILYIPSPSLLYGLCLIKGLCFGFVSAGCLLAWGSAGWLVRLLLMFSDFLSLVPLWWCWLSCHPFRVQRNNASVVVSALIAACIVCLDYFCVSPIFAKVFEY